MKAEPARMIAEIVDLRVRLCYSSTSLVKYLKDTYDINTTRAYELIKDARVVMGELYNNINTDPIKDSILKMENMMENAILNKDIRVALDIQKELNKVNQLYVERLDITSGGDKITGININIVKPDENKEEGGDKH